MRPAALYFYSEPYMLASPGKTFFYIFCFSDFVEFSLACQNKTSIIDVSAKKGLALYIMPDLKGSP